MYLDFENISSSNQVKDMSGNGNDAAMLKGAKISGRKLGMQSVYTVEIFLIPEISIYFYNIHSR